MLSVVQAVPAEMVSAVPATGAASAAWLLVAIPLLSAALLLLLGRRADSWGHWFGVGASTASFVLAVAITVQELGLPAEERVMAHSLYTWISTGDLTIDFATRVDTLSMSFVLLVTFVGTLIHVYSVAYMEHDTDRRRFFAYMNFFVAAMLLLVLADSFALLFVGWEGVGLIRKTRALSPCSGRHLHRPRAFPPVPGGLR